MKNPSFTGTDTFLLRAQRAEQRRCLLLAFVLGAMAVIYTMRRLLGGVVMGEPRVFIPVISIVAAAIAFQLASYGVLRRANTAGRLLPVWGWWATAAFDLAVPIALLTDMHFFSPRGPVAALSGPTVLLLPIVIMLTVLRLRPVFALATGLVAGIAHAALAAHTLMVSDITPDTVYFAYGVLLMLTGLAASLVSREVRDYVREAVREATAREAEHRRLDAIEHDLSIARDIQRGLLPSAPPALPGFDIAGMSRSADQTGGDYYDWQLLPDGRTVMVMADVTGHGIGPAIVMAVCRAYARASAPLVSGLEPLLERLNSLVHADVGGSSRFITFAVGLLDPATARLDLLSAGHGPTLLFTARDRGIKRFDGDGMPLGILPEGNYDKARCLALQPGDIVLLMTDGFFEALRPSDNAAFGIERIEKLLGDHSAEPAEAILSHLDAAVRAHIEGSPQLDDMTAIVLKRL